MMGVVFYQDELSECFDEDENDVNHQLFPLISPHHMLTEHIWKILESRARQHSGQLVKHQQMREYLLYKRS